MPNQMSPADLCLKIDEVCDTVRLQIVGDPVRAFEYQQAMTDAGAFVLGGFAGAPPNQYQCPGNYQGPVPPTLSCWLTANPGWTVQEAAADILTTAAKFTGAMTYLRAARLEGKAAVMSAPDPDTAEAVFEATISKILALTAGS